MKTTRFLNRNKIMITRKFGILTPEGQPKKKANIDEWMSIVQSKATTTEGKSYTLQLTSLINYFNRKFEESDKSKINWEEWDQKIQTKGVVETIKNNVENLIKEKYNKPRKVGKYSKDGQLVKVYNTVRECKKEHAGCVHVLSGQRNQAGGYTFKYID